MAKDDGGPTGGQDDRLVIMGLLGIVFFCLLGIVVEDILKAASNDALLTIGSLAAGALAGRISQKATASVPPDTRTAVEIRDSARPPVGEDDFAVIGRAATKSIIAEAMRQMGTPPSDRAGEQPKQ